MRVNKQLKQMIVLLALITVASTVALASVFVYNPLTININAVAPPVQFWPGSNANQADLGGNTITVTIGANKTSETITIHPTYQSTYYLNVSLINNTDTATTYYVWIKVLTPATLPAGSEAYLILNDTASTQVDLLTTGSYGPITLAPGGLLQMDLNVTLPEGVQLPAATSAELQVIYSTQSSETPP